MSAEPPKVVRYGDFRDLLRLFCLNDLDSRFLDRLFQSLFAGSAFLGHPLEHASELSERIWPHRDFIEAD